MDTIKTWAGPSTVGHSLPSNPSHSLPEPGSLPSQIGKFPVVRRLGAGAMGEVFLCLQPGLERYVAIKVMRGGMAQWPRFQREARSAAKLVHPHIVRVYDVGHDHETPYIVMEFIDGQPLSNLIGTPYLSLPVSLRLLLHLSEALAHAHAQQIIHRDLKPANILLDQTGRPLLTDFGLARSLLNEVSLSGSNDLIGTPRYMAPEQILGERDEQDQRVDVFSLGVVMYEMLSGRPPFDAANVVQILRQVADDDPVPLQKLNEAIPPAVAAICSKALEKRPADRFATAAEMHQALRDVLLSESSLSPSGELRANDYLNAFVPIGKAVPNTLSYPVRPNHRSFWAVAIAGVLVGIAIWQTLLMVLPAQPQNRLNTEAFVAAKGRILGEVEEICKGAMRVSEKQSPRDLLRQNLDEVSLLLRQSPDDYDLALARIRLLRRGGECLAAEAEATNLMVKFSDHLALRLERALARFQLRVLYLGAWDATELKHPISLQFSEDSEFFQNSSSASLKHLAQMLNHVADPDSTELWQLSTTATDITDGLVSTADLFMVRGELLFRAAEEAELTHNDEDASTPLYGPLADLAKKTLRVGMEADPYHSGLLFLKATSFSRRVGYDRGVGSSDRDSSIKRSLPQFEAAIERFRRVTLRLGCDTSAARAVLLANRGWTEPAIDQLQDALSYRPTIPHLKAAQVWLKLSSPEDGVHNADSLNALARELEETASEAPDDSLAPYVRGIIDLASGRYADARKEIQECASRLGPEDHWHHVNDSQAEWIKSVAKGEIPFLYHARAAIAEHPFAPDVLIKINQTTLDRINDPELVSASDISPEDRQKYLAWVNFAMAEIYTGLEDKPAAYRHLTQALEQHTSDIHGPMAREHWAFSSLTSDSEFQDLCDKFPAPSEPSEPTDSAEPGEPSYPSDSD